MAINDKQQYASEINHHQIPLQKLESSWPYKDNIQPRRKNMSSFVVRHKGKIVHEGKKIPERYKLLPELYDVDEQYNTTFFVDKNGLTIGEFKCPKKAATFARMINGNIRTYQPSDDDRDEELRAMRSERNINQQFSEENKGSKRRYLGKPEKI